MRIIINFVLFQACWFACVLGAVKQMPWLGVVVSIIVLAGHVVFAANKPRELKLMLAATLAGLVFDAISLQFGWVSYDYMPFWPSFLAPAWMLILWTNLAITLNYSLAWLKSRTLLSAIFGGVGGVLAYLAGQQLGALQIHNMPAMVIYLALGWGLLLPALFWLNTEKSIFPNTQHV